MMENDTWTNNLDITLPVDVQAPNVVGPSAGTVITKKLKKNVSSFYGYQWLYITYMTQIMSFQMANKSEWISWYNECLFFYSVALLRQAQ